MAVTKMSKFYFARDGVTNRNIKMVFSMKISQESVKIHVLNSPELQHVKNNILSMLLLPLQKKRL